MAFSFIFFMSCYLVALGILITQTHTHAFKGTRIQQVFGVLIIVAGFNVLHAVLNMTAASPS